MCVTVVISCEKLHNSKFAHIFLNPECMKMSKYHKKNTDTPVNKPLVLQHSFIVPINRVFQNSFVHVEEKKSSHSLKPVFSASSSLKLWNVERTLYGQCPGEAFRLRSIQNYHNEPINTSNPTEPVRNTVRILIQAKTSSHDVDSHTPKT